MMMKIFILASEEQKNEILFIPLVNRSSITFAHEFPQKRDIKNHEVFFLLSDFQVENYGIFKGKSVYLNKVIETLGELNLPRNFKRMNAWPGFLKSKIWEIVSNDIQNDDEVFNLLNRKGVVVKDEPGLISARIISMIVNEAFLAREENISTKEEIDIAMKLGTGYPYGPFEWAEKIGHENILHLLETLSVKEKRYTPSQTLKMYLEKSGKNL